MTEDVTTGPIGLRVGGITLLAGVLWTIAGIPGAALAAVVGVVWVLVETPYTVAVGELLYAVGVAEAGVIGLVGAVSFGVLFVPELLGRWETKTALLAAVVLFVSAAALAASALAESLLVAAAIACLGYGTVAYGVHRYESVRLGMVNPGP